MTPISSHDRERIRNLAELYADRVISPEEFTDLQSSLRESPAAREVFWDAMQCNTLLISWGSEGGGARRGQPLRPTASLAPRLTRRVGWAAGLAAAAVVTLVLGWRVPWRQWRPRPQAPVVADIAIVTAAKGVEWESPRAFNGQSFGPRRLSISAGDLRLGLRSGVDVAIRGPAEFSVLSAGRMELVRGALVARVPAGAEGFTVSTATVDIVDLGTEFGIRSQADGTADVVVYQGLVEAQSRLAAFQSPETLGADQAKRFFADGRQVDLERIPEDVFPRLAHRGDGLPIASGAVKLLAEPPQDLSRLMSNEFVVLYRESSGVTVPAGSPVDVSKPGIYASASSIKTAAVAGGRVVDSYLLRFASRGDLPRASPDVQGLTLEGTVTFPRPIRGILCLKPSLDATDRTFSRAREDTSRVAWFRGLEFDDGDHVVLSTDSRTIWFSLRVQGHSDQIRVLVDSGS